MKKILRQSDSPSKIPALDPPEYLTVPCHFLQRKRESFQNEVLFGKCRASKIGYIRKAKEMKEELEKKLKNGIHKSVQISTCVIYLTFSVGKVNCIGS